MGSGVWTPGHHCVKLHGTCCYWRERQDGWLIAEHRRASQSIVEHRREFRESTGRAESPCTGRAAVEGGRLTPELARCAPASIQSPWKKSPLEPPREPPPEPPRASHQAPPPLLPPPLLLLGAFAPDFPRARAPMPTPAPPSADWDVWPSAAAGGDGIGGGSSSGCEGLRNVRQSTSVRQACTTIIADCSVASA